MENPIFTWDVPRIRGVPRVASEPFYENTRSTAGCEFCIPLSAWTIASNNPSENERKWCETGSFSLTWSTIFFKSRAKKLKPPNQAQRTHDILTTNERLTHLCFRDAHDVLLSAGHCCSRMSLPVVAQRLLKVKCPLYSTHNTSIFISWQINAYLKRCLAPRDVRRAQDGEKQAHTRAERNFEAEICFALWAFASVSCVSLHSSKAFSKSATRVLFSKREIFSSQEQRN